MELTSQIFKKTHSWLQCSVQTSWGQGQEQEVRSSCVNEVRDDSSDESNSGGGSEQPSTSGNILMFIQERLLITHYVQTEGKRRIEHTYAVFAINNYGVLDKLKSSQRNVLGCSAVVQCTFSVHGILGLILSTTKTQVQKIYWSQFGEGEDQKLCFEYVQFEKNVTNVGVKSYT